MLTWKIVVSAEASVLYIYIDDMVSSGEVDKKSKALVSYNNNNNNNKNISVGLLGWDMLLCSTQNSILLLVWDTVI